MLKQPNYFTSCLGGIITTVVGLFSTYMNNNLILFFITMMIFLISTVYFVVGIDFINERNKFKGVKTFIFPSSKEDLIVLSRIIVYLFSAGIVIFLSDKFFL